MKFHDLVRKYVIGNRNLCHDWSEFPSFQDLHTVDLEEFRHGGTNITAFRLVDPEKPEIQKVIQDWIYGEKRYNRELDMGQNSNKVRRVSRRRVTVGIDRRCYGIAAAILKSFISPMPILCSQSININNIREIYTQRRKV